jgi:hypothetical protein
MLLYVFGADFGTYIGLRAILVGFRWFLIISRLSRNRSPRFLLHFLGIVAKICRLRIVSGVLYRCHKTVADYLVL